MALKPYVVEVFEPNYIRTTISYRGRLGAGSYHFNQMCDSEDDVKTLLQVIGKALAQHTGQPVEWQPGHGGRLRSRPTVRKTWGPPTVKRGE